MSVQAPAAFPLQWPAGRPRTMPARRVKGLFSRVAISEPGFRKSLPVTLAEAFRRLDREIDALGGRYAVLSSNVELRLNGQPRSGQPNPGDPGAVAYFQLKGRPLALACDRYTRVEQNVAAIASHIEATRRIERYGVASAEQMFAGFEALPAPIVPDDWRGALDFPETLMDAEATWRRKIREHHPDRPGGTTAAAAILNAAIERAREVFR